MKKLCAVTICLLLPILASAASLDMPSQPLDASLKELSKAAGVQIVFTDEVTERGVPAPALNGIRSIEGALDTLLAKTSLSYHVLDSGTIEITPIDEIQITGRYEKLSAMKKEYEKLEDEFYREYNRLNTIRDYSVSCSSQGVHIHSRVCQPAFVEKALAAEYGDGRHPGLPAFAAIAQTTPTYRKNMITLVNNNPKLLELLMKRSAAAQRYQVVRKQKFAGGKIFAWD